MANVLTKREIHRMRCSSSRDIVSAGDVRICPHGKIQEAYFPLGLCHPLWVDITNPIRKRRAKRLMREES